MSDLLAELLPVGGAVNAGTVRNRIRRVGACIARLRPTGAPDPESAASAPSVVIGLDGDYLRSGHRRPERDFEVIAGKVRLCAQLQFHDRIRRRDRERWYPSRRPGDGALGWRRGVLEATATADALEPMDRSALSRRARHIRAFQADNDKIDSIVAAPSVTGEGQERQANSWGPSCCETESLA